MNILKWFEYLPEDLWNAMVCYAHEQDLENKECNSLSEAVWALNWDRADQATDIDDDAVVFIARLSDHSLWNKYRLISEEDWELLEKVKAARSEALFTKHVVPNRDLEDFVGDILPPRKKSFPDVIQKK